MSKQRRRHNGHNGRHSYQNHNRSENGGSKKKKPEPTHLENLFRDIGSLVGSMERSMTAISKAAADIGETAGKVRVDCIKAIDNLRKGKRRKRRNHKTVADEDPKPTDDFDDD